MRTTATHSNNPYIAACVVYYYSPNHLSGAGVDVRQVDAAGFEVDDEHGEAYPRQRGKLVESQSTDLDPVDGVVWLRTADCEGEVLGVERRDSFLQRGKKIRDVGVLTVEESRTDTAFFRFLGYTKWQLRHGGCSHRHMAGWRDERGNDKTLTEQKLHAAGVADSSKRWTQQ